MKKRIFIFFVSALVLLPSVWAQQASMDLVAGKIIKFESSILNQVRDIFISLPPFYEKSKTKYPVLFVLDAEGNYPFASGTLNFLGQTARMPQMIVVGIPNTNRSVDFTPSVVSRYKSGGADRFIEFLKDELIPFIDTNYRTEQFRILYGHSLAGMFTIYSMNKQPDLFHANIAASPALYYDNNYLFRRFNERVVLPAEEHRFLYLAVGNEPRFEPAIERYGEILDDHDSDWLHWDLQQLENEDHNSIRLKALYDGLEFIFSKWRINDDELDRGCDSIREHYSSLSEIYNYNVIPSERTLNTVGYMYLRLERLEEATRVFEYNVELYPESANVYDSLGDAFEKRNILTKAFDNYTKATEISERLNLPEKDIFRQHLKRVAKQLK